jgi:endonuclease III
VKTRKAKKPGKAVVQSVCDLLELRYRSPRHGNPTDPLSDLFFLLISNRTGAQVAARTFADVCQAFPAWSDLTPETHHVLEVLLRPAGLQRLRAQQMVAILTQLRSDFGTATLYPIAQWPAADAERYLTRLPGVSLKVAKCVMSV